MIAEERIPSSPPIIDPLPAGMPRPLWSVMIPVYNCSGFLRETLLSVLVQDPGEEIMQIEVVDDASTDNDVESLVKEIGKGRIGYFRQSENRGSLRNFETCLNRSRGQYVHLLHGDDRVKPGFYSAMQNLFDEYNNVGAAFCRYQYIDEEGVLLGTREPLLPHTGILPDALKRLAERQHIQYAAMAVRRSVYEDLGAFYIAHYGEDWEMWVRIASRYPIAYTPETFAEYRVHQSSISGSRLLNGNHIHDINKVFQAIEAHIPLNERPAISRKLRANYARWSINLIERQWVMNKDKLVVREHLNKVNAFYSDWHLFFKSLKLRIRTFFPVKAFPPITLYNYKLEEYLTDIPQLLKQNNIKYIFSWYGERVGELSLAEHSYFDNQTFLYWIFVSLKPFIEARASNEMGAYNEAWKKLDANALVGILHRIRRKPEDISALQHLPITVVICTHNRPVQLRKCLKSLKNLSPSPQQILVVDNDPHKNYTRNIIQEFDGIDYLEEPRKGLDIARNTGARNAINEVVAYIDDDVIVEPDWLINIWEGFNDESIDGVTGLVLPVSLNVECQQVFEEYWGLNKGYAEKLYDRTFLSSNTRYGPPVWQIGAGANMAFRVSAFQKFGYFDERLDAGAAGCSGDSEYWFRILNKGGKILYNPRAVVHHSHRSDNYGFQWQIFNYMRGHVAAAIIQHRQAPGLGYLRRIYIYFPLYYLSLIVKGFPYYNGRYSTLKKEIYGVLSGIKFYKKNSSKPSNS